MVSLVRAMPFSPHSAPNSAPKPAWHQDRFTGCPVPSTIISQCNIKCTSVCGCVGWRGMLYQVYQAHCDLMEPVRVLAGMVAGSGGPGLRRLADHALMRHLTAAYEIIARAGLTHERPPFDIHSVTVGNREVKVTEEPVLVTPFGTLLRFKKDVQATQPRVVLVAPLSGHFATLMRATVATMLPEHDVYVTDWHNARDIALLHGRFGFDDYIAHLIR